MAPQPYGSLPEEDPGGCHLISENYAYALQLILGFAALAGLVVSATADSLDDRSILPRIFKAPSSSLYKQYYLPIAPGDSNVAGLAAPESTAAVTPMCFAVSWVRPRAKHQRSVNSKKRARVFLSSFPEISKASGRSFSPVPIHRTSLSLFLYLKL